MIEDIFHQQRQTSMDALKQSNVSTQSVRSVDVQDRVTTQEIPIVRRLRHEIIASFFAIAEGSNKHSKSLDQPTNLSSRPDQL